MSFFERYVQFGVRAACKAYAVKYAEDDGVARAPVAGDTPDGYAAVDLDNSIDRAFEAAERYWSDPSDMAQPGVMHGALNTWPRKGVAMPETMAVPLITSPTAS